MQLPKIKVGIDLVKIENVDQLLADPEAAAKVFHPGEFEVQSHQQLAGIYAAKGAFFKALEQPPKWLEVELSHKPNGTPALNWSKSFQILGADVSITHDGEYAAASVMLIVPKGDGE